MDIRNELLSKILCGDSSCKVTVLNWRVNDNVMNSGNNNTSELSRLAVNYQKKGKIFKKSFVLKIPSAHPMYSVGMKYKIYDREYPIYTTILEEMYKIDGEHIGPKVYYTDDKCSLILKDLSQSGYKVVDRHKQLDYDHCRIVLKNLAKFHALSVKLDQMSKISKSIKKTPWLEDVDHVDETIEWMQNGCEQVVKYIDPKFDLTNKILRLKENAFRRATTEVLPERFPFSVLNHGDCWTGNFMFKFDKYGIVKKMKFIDFQNSFWTSPAFDILLFTLTSMQFGVFEKHYDFLIETYIETLNKVLRFLQCGSYSVAELRRDMYDLRIYVVLSLGVILPVCLSSYENPINYKNTIIDGRVDYGEFNKVYKNEIYTKILNKWIAYYVDKGVFD